MFCLAWQVKRRWCRRYCVERPLRASPFEVAYVHPSVYTALPRQKEQEGQNRGFPPFPPPSRSLSVCLSRLLPPFSLLLPLFLPTRSPSILGLYSRGESMRVCMHSLRSGMTGERIQFPSSLSCLHLQLRPRSDHPRWLLAFPSPSPPLLAGSNETKPSLPSLLPARLVSRPFRRMDRQERARARYRENLSITINLTD